MEQEKQACCTVKSALNSTVEPVLEDHTIDHENVVSQDRFFLVTGSITKKHEIRSKIFQIFQSR